MTPRFHWAWFILAASFLTVFASYSTRLSYGILMPEMIRTLGITKTEAGGIASSFYVAYTIFAPLVGFLSDRVSTRRLIVFFCVIQGVGTVLMATPTSLWQACLFFGIVGVGCSAMWAPVVAMVQRWFGFRRRGAVLGILSISYAIGYGLMGLLLPLIVKQYSWRACWFILSLLSFALVPVNAFLLRTKPQDLQIPPWGEELHQPAAGELSSPPKHFPYRDLLKLHNLWMGGMAYFFSGFTAYIINIFIVTYANLELRFPFAQSASLASFIAFSGIPGGLLILTLSDYLGRKKCLFLINLSYTAAIGLLIWAGNSWPALTTASCLYGIVYAATWPMYAAAGADFFPPGTTGSVLGFWTLFFGISLILAPTVGGYIADVAGSFRWSFAAAGGTGVAAAFFVSRIQKR